MMSGWRGSLREKENLGRKTSPNGSKSSQYANASIRPIEIFFGGEGLRMEKRREIENKKGRRERRGERKGR